MNKFMTDSQIMISVVLFSSSWLDCNSTGDLSLAFPFQLFLQTEHVWFQLLQHPLFLHLLFHLLPPPSSFSSPLLPSTLWLIPLNPFLAPSFQAHSPVAVGFLWIFLSSFPFGRQFQQRTERGLLWDVSLDLLLLVHSVVFHRESHGALLSCECIAASSRGF